MRKTLVLSAFFLVLGWGILGRTAWKEEGVWGSSSNPSGGVLSFSAQIAAESAPVCSAPESDAYQTGALKAGDVVEIFFRTGNGWCAIRPPEGSFSWINAEYVNRRDQNNGTIVCPESGKEVPVRVGADSVMKSSGVQVGLKNGKQVKILGETTLTGGKTWLKIAPPSGEFRWINENLLTRDDFFDQIPDRLTRHEDLLAQGGVSESFGDSSSSEAEVAAMNPVPQVAERLHEEIFDPAVEKTVAAQPEPISKVSFENGFNKELAQLYRDLFTAVERSGSNEVYDLLAERASVLFTLAADDVQRSEAQKAYEKIKSHRGGTFVAPKGGTLVDGNEFTAAEPLYPSPAALTGATGNPGQLMRENQRIVFSVNPGNAERSGMGKNVSGQAVTSRAATGKATAKPDHGVRFAFAPRDDQSKDAADRKGLFTGKPSAIVPPANYSYPAPARLKVAPQDTPSGVTKSTSDAEGTAPVTPTVPSMKIDSTSNRDAFLAESTPQSREIRQVAAFVKPDLPKETGTGLVAETTGAPLTGATANSPTTSEIPASLSFTQRARYDVAGTLGYFPDQKDGSPAYALVNQSEGKLVILCYVAPQPGKSLDPFVGKKIGIGGTRGWFKMGGENRKMITAETIHLLEK